jgi:hypothetical protein
LKEKFDNYIQEEDKIITRIKIIAKYPMTGCSTELIQSRMKELDKIEEEYRNKFFQIMHKPDLPYLRAQLVLVNKTEQELYLNFNRNIKWIWKLIEEFSQQMNQIHMQEVVLLDAEKDGVFDLESIEKRLYQSKRASHIRRANFFKQDGNQENVTFDSSEQKKDADDFIVLTDYFSDLQIGKGMT